MLQEVVERVLFEVRLSGVTLESGAEMPLRRARGWAAGPVGTIAWIEATGAQIIATGDAIPDRETLVAGRPFDDVPTTTPPMVDGHPVRPPAPVVLLIHALTGDMRAGGNNGWWAPIVAPGGTIDTTANIAICFNNLGGCYGTSGPADAEFPTRADETDTPAPQPRRGVVLRRDDAPAAITTWDQARTHLDALDALGVGPISMVTGGSVGGMQTVCVAMLAPERCARVVPFAGCVAAPAWILAWNHVARQLIERDPDFPDAARGLELARQMAHVTYRAPAGLDVRQGRRMTTVAGPDVWSSQSHYDMQTYLEHQGGKLRTRFDPRSYLALIDAMDHHDALRRPRWIDDSVPWSLGRITAPTISVVIDSDHLFLPDEGRRIADLIREAGGTARAVTLQSLHGHDAFLIEWQQVRDAIEAVYTLPSTP